MEKGGEGVGREHGFGFDLNPKKRTKERRKAGQRGESLEMRFSLMRQEGKKRGRNKGG